jgi:hypothetical protein
MLPARSVRTSFLLKSPVAGRDRRSAGVAGLSAFLVRFSARS